MAGDEAILRREGDRLIIEPIVKQGLLAVLATLTPLRDCFPNAADGLLPAEDVAF